MSERAQLVLVFAAGLVIHLGISWYQVVDEGGLVLRAAAVAAAFLAALATLARGRDWLRRAFDVSGSYGWLKALVRLSLLGLVLLAFASSLVAVVNGAFDRSEPVARELKVLRVSTPGVRRRAQAGVVSWRYGRTEETILISAAQYFALKDKRLLRLTTRSGALGVEWVERIEVP